MYRYDEIDQRLVDERVRQFRGQTERFLRGELSEDEFRALRLRNGLYIQRYAPMLRIAIPYGLLSTRQLRKLADISRKYDRGYGHFSTRQNLQLNWPKLEQVPDILAELATVQMHAIQTSGNSFRNVTTDHFAGVAQDEVVDSFVWCDNIHKARIKILVKERGPDKFREEVEAEWAHLKDGPATLIAEEIERVAARFTRPAYERLPDLDLETIGVAGFTAWAKRNVQPHK